MTANGRQRGLDDTGQLGRIEGRLGVRSRLTACRWPSSTTTTPTTSTTATSTTPLREARST